MKFTINDYTGERSWEWDGNTAFVIGRSNKCELPVETDGASRKHCRIWVENECYFIEDLGSRNGTLVNGKPVTKNKLQPGDRIQVGRAQIYFGDMPPVPPSSKGSVVVTPVVPPQTSLVSPVYLIMAALVAIGLSLLLAQSEVFSGRQQPTNPGSRESKTGEPSKTSKIGDPSHKPGKSNSNGDPAKNNGSRQSSAPGEDAVAVRSWKRLRDQIGDEEQLRQSYRDFIAEYPDTGVADQAQSRLRFLEQWQNYQEDRQLQMLTTEVASLISLNKFAAAAYLTRFYQSKSNTPDQLRRYHDLYQKIENQATSHYHEIARQAKIFVQRNDNLGASELYLQNLSDWAPFLFYPQALKQIKKLAMPGQQSSKPRQSNSESGKPLASAQEKQSQEKQATLDAVKESLKRYQYRQAQAQMDQLLRQQASAATSKPYREVARSLSAQRQLFEFLLTQIPRQRVALELTDGITGIITKATSNDFTLEVIREAESKAIMTESWERLQSYQMIRLYEQLPLMAEHKLALAIFCWDNDARSEAWPLLIEVYQGVPALKSAIETFLANRLKITIPIGGLTVCEERLITREQARIDQEQRQKLKLQAEQIQQSLQKEQRQNRAEYYYQKAMAMQYSSRYQDGRRLFAAIARKFPQSAIASKAAEKVDDPLLRTKPIVVNGPSGNRIDIYIMGDGYTIKESHQKNFDDLAYRTAKNFLKDEPLREYRNYFNFHQMNIASRERGCDIVPGNTKKDTALGSVCRNGFMEVDHQLVKKFLARAKNNDGQVIVFANGGGGGATGGNGIIAAPPGKFSLLAHEFGHSFGNLGDEYSFRPGSASTGSASESKKSRFGFKKIDGHWVRVQDVPEHIIAPNLLAGSNKQALLAICPWKHWIEKSGNWKPRGMQEVGLFEGGNYRNHDVWRPQQDCRMRTCQSEFCVVCMETIVRKIYRYVRPIDTYEPQKAKIECQGDGTLLFKICPLQPRTHDLTVEWRLEVDTVQESEYGRLTGVGKSRRLKGEQATDSQGRKWHYLRLATAKLSSGKYFVIAKVSDPTPWVRQDPDNRLTQEQRWHITIPKLEPK